MTAHRAVVYKARDGWRFRVQALNGEVIGVGEAYTRRWSCIRAVKKDTDASTIEIHDDRGRLVRTIDR